MDQADAELFDELMASVRRVASAGAFTLGDEVEAFEAEFADYCGTEYAVGVSSGTEAIALSLRALGVEPGSEVIVPANSFIATAEAVSMVGATPRLVDVDPDTHNITGEIVERNLTRRTACVVPVHLYGRPVEMDSVLEVARQAGVPVLEDACQAHGAVYAGRRVGSIGHCGCFSFYPAKNLGAWGDGGAVVTSDPALADRIRLFRSHGERERYHHAVRGTTARLDAIQAAVLRVKLARLDTWNEQRRANASALTAALEGSAVRPPAAPGADADHVFHQYVVMSKHRDALRDHLAAVDIATGIHYPVPIHLTPAYAHLGLSRGDLRVVERLAGEVCSLPIFPSMPAQMIDTLATAIHGFGSADPGDFDARRAA